MSRRKRWLLRSSCALVLSLLVAWIVITHSTVTSAIVLPRLASALGVELDASRVVITIDGRVVMEGVEARVPGIDHSAATFFRVDRLNATVDWTTAWRLGRPAVSRIVLTNPTVRLSQSIDDEQLNVAALRLVSSAAGPLELPTIIAQNAIVEVGEHSSTSYTALRRLFMSGELTPAPGAVQAYDVNLREAGPSIAFPGSPTSLRLVGRIDDDGAEITMTGIKLDGISPDAVPSPIRTQYSNLDLKGSVTQARFNYSHTRGVVVTMVLDNVDISPPLPPERLESGATRPLRMHRTSGLISLSQSGLRATLTGAIEDLPYEVEVDYQGTTADAPFTATLTTDQFQVQENPDLLPYAPRIVRKRLANFSNPTAVVDASLTVSREPPTADGPSPVEVDGRLEFVQGEAAFDKFPYPFKDMVARVHFTDERIVIEEITGVSPSGAALVASALVEPLTTEAFVNVDIDVQGVPIDELLLECLGPQRRELADAILSESEYRRLLDSGVISEDGVDAPKFTLGGVGDMKVNVQREHGNTDTWHVLVDIYFDEAGFLVDRFPYPIIGRDVVLRIDDDTIKLVEGRFTGLEGGDANVIAEAIFDRELNGGTYIPTIHVDAAGVPLGDLIASALPDTPLGESESLSPRTIVKALGMDGLAQASIDVGLREDGSLGYDAVAEIKEATSAPAPLDGSSSMTARDITASIKSTESSLHLEASAVAGDENPARVSVFVDSQFNSSTISRVEASGVDATLPLECFVAIFSEKAAKELRATCLEMRPEGLVDLIVLSTSDGPSWTTVEISAPGDVAFDLFEGRIALSEVEGSAVIEASENPWIDFRSTKAAIVYDDAPAGRVTMTGRAPLAALGKREAPTDLGPDLGALQLAADDALIESGLSRWIIGSYLPEGMLALYDEHQPRGILDADVSLKTVVDETGHYSWDPTGTLHPASLTILRRGLDVPLTMEGSVDFGQRWGDITGVTVTAPTWRGSFAGDWRARTLAVDYEVTVDLQAAGLTPDLRAMLVDELIEKLDAVKLTIDGPVALRGGRISGSRTGDDETSQVAFHGDIDFKDAALEPGAPLSECSGTVDVGFELLPERGPAAYEIAVSLDQMRAAGVRLTDARALLLSADREREMLMPHFSARSHAGRISASAHVWPKNSTDLDYRTDIRLSGVRFGPVIADLTPLEEGQIPDENVWQVNDDRSRGEVDAGIMLAGVVGRPETRRGSGVIEVLGGSVLRLPNLIVRLIEVSNLQPPANERLDYARAEFFIDGEFIGFEDLSVFSRSVSILGTGSLEWGTKTLDLRFHTRAARRIPMLSPILEGIRNELATATVRGPIDDYDVSVEQFPGDSALVEALFKARRNRVRSVSRAPDAAPLQPRANAPNNDE